VIALLDKLLREVPMSVFPGRAGPNRFIVRDGGEGPADTRQAFVFSEGRREPTLIVKMARNRRGAELLRGEHANLTKLSGAPEEWFRLSVPRPIFYKERQGYAFLAETVLPAAVREGLVDAVDGFCDRIGFSPAQIGVLFDVASAHGLPVKLHADQYTDIGAGAVVARYRGLSADHLEFASEATVRAMAEAGTVATLIPGANWTLFETAKPPVDLFRRYGVPMAVATNNNPSSSPTCSPTMMMNMATHLFRITPEEALAGFTRVGAQVLGMAATHGTLAVGKAADLAVWNVAHPMELAYRIADTPCAAVIKEGRVIYEATPPRIAPRV
jgi:imidazolonepropionase